MKNKIIIVIIIGATVIGGSFFVKKAVTDNIFSSGKVNDDTLSFSYILPNIEGEGFDISKLDLDGSIIKDKIVNMYEDDTSDKKTEFEFLGEKYELKYCYSTNSIRSIQDFHCYRADEHTDLYLYDDGSFRGYYDSRFIDTGEKNFISDEESEQIAREYLNSLDEKVNLDGYICRISKGEQSEIIVKFVKCVGKLDTEEYYILNMTPSGKIWQVCFINIGSFDNIDLEKLSESKIASDDVVKELKESLSKKLDENEYIDEVYEMGFYMTKDGKISRELQVDIVKEGGHCPYPLTVLVQLDKEDFLRQ